MKHPKVVVGYFIDDEMFVRAVTPPEYLEWIKWLDSDEIIEFFEGLLNLVAQISQKKERGEALTIFLGGWRAVATTREDLYISEEIDDLDEDVMDSLAMDIADATDQLREFGAELAEAQLEKESRPANIYRAPEPTIDLTEQQRDHYVAQPVSELELTVRAANCLERANIKTIRDLVIKTDRELLEYKGFGRGVLREIEEQLANMGLYLGMELDDKDYEEDEGIY